MQSRAQSALLPSARYAAIAAHLAGPALMVLVIGLAVQLAIPLNGPLYNVTGTAMALFMLSLVCTVGFIWSVLLGPALAWDQEARLLVFALTVGWINVITSAGLLAVAWWFVLRDQAEFGFHPAGVGCAALLPFISAGLTWSAMRLCIHRRWLRPFHDDKHCAACGYDIRHSPGPACPECGEPFPAGPDAG